MVTYLRRLVTVLTVTMIAGVLAVTTLLVIRLSAWRSIEVPERIALPEDSVAEAWTMGRGWVAVVTDKNEILIYDADDGTLRQRVEIETE